MMARSKYHSYSLHSKGAVCRKRWADAGKCIVGIDVEKDIKLRALLCEAQHQLRMGPYTNKTTLGGSLSHNVISEYPNYLYIYSPHRAFMYILASDIVFLWNSWVCIWVRNLCLSLFLMPLLNLFSFCLIALSWFIWFCFVFSFLIIP